MTKDNFYLFANWKMYLDYDESVALAEAIKAAEAGISKKIQMAVFPSPVATAKIKEVLVGSRILVGAQNTFWVDKGGYTGEVSAAMYQAVGSTYALVGHSERRHQFHETNHEVRQKLEAILAANLIPVLCVGETHAERESGKTEEIIEVQLRAAFSNLAWPKDLPVIVAYEPVWAISQGTDKLGGHCNAAEASRINQLIANMTAKLLNIAPQVIFGGSVRAETIKEYFETPDIDGVLVGAAATKITTWLEMTRALEI